MVSPSKSKYSRVANATNSNKVKLVRGTKPLIYFKFYLDIENHTTATKIESKIKELGGSIEFFLNKDITHFITDKNFQQTTSQQLSSQSPSSNQLLTPKVGSSTAVQFVNELPSSSPKLNANNSSNDFKVSTVKQISRADAMLQKARQQHHQTNELQSTNTKINQTSPIQVAKDSNTTIWTTDYTIRYLEKIYNSLRHFSNSSLATGSKSISINNQSIRYRSKNVKHLKGDFIKIESFQKNYRPFYKEFKNWPTLNFSASLTNSPFDTESSTDKKRKKSSKNCFSRLDSRTTAFTTTNNTTADNIVSSDSGSAVATNINRMTRKSRSAKIVKCIKNTAAKNNSKIGDLSDEYYEQNIKQCGYCEICRVEYDVLKIHLKTDEHLNFVKNDANFLSLDKLINSSANVEAFLKLNGNCTEKSETELLVTAEILSKRREVRGSAKKNMKKVIGKCASRDYEMRELFENQEKLLNGYAELNQINDLKLSRSLRSTYVAAEKAKAISKVGVGNAEKKRLKNRRATVDDEEVEEGDCKAVRLRRQSTTMRRINYVEPKDTVVEYDSDEDMEEAKDIKNKVDKSKIKLYGVRWRPPRSSSHDRTTSANQSTPLVYKVIDDKSKISNNISAPSTTTRRNCTETSINSDKTNDALHAGSLIVKFKRLRQSELSLLNDEAENFMFPQKKENDNDHDHIETDTDDDRQTTSERTANDNQSLALPSSESQSTRASAKKNGQKQRDDMERLLLVDVSVSSCCRTRRRRNQLEAFLNDNNDYYKFEDPGSRLRFQETPIQSATTVLNDVKESTDDSDAPRDGMGDSSDIHAPANKKKRWHLIQDLASENVKCQKFSFERVPSSEPWYDAFHRQDYGIQRVYSYFGNTAYRKLPFEIGPLPPLAPNCCKKPPAELTTTSSSLPAVATKSNVKEHNSFKNKIIPNNESTTAKDLKSNVSTTSNTTAATTMTASSLLNRRIAASIVGFKRKQTLVDSDKPRKSPREHASTLAILFQQRKNRDSVTGIETGETSSNNSYSNYLNKLTENLLNNDDTTNSSNSNMSSNRFDAVRLAGRVTRASRPTSGVKKLVRQNSANDESSVYSQSTATIANREDNIYTSSSCTLKRQVDNMLNNAYLDDDIDNVSIDIKFDEDEDVKPQHYNDSVNLMDIDLSDMKKDFVELLSSDLSNELFSVGAAVKKEIQVKRRVMYDIRKARPMGPIPADLRFGVGGKKKANRTGWPNIVRRKIVTRKVKKSVDEETGVFESTIIENNMAETTVLKEDEEEDDETQLLNRSDNESILTNDDLDKEDEDLRPPPKLKSEDRNSVNSEVFVVSSDSLDTTSVVAFKTDIDNLSTKSVYEDAVCEPFVPDIADVVKNHSRRKTQQNPKYFSSQYTNNLPYFNSTSSPSSPKKLSPNEKSVSIKNCISTRSTGLVASVIPITPDKRKAMTPKKSTTPTSSTQRTFTPASSNANITQTNNNRAASPLTPTKSPKFSPRKLRKPRGRWYRER